MPIHLPTLIDFLERASCLDMYMVGPLIPTLGSTPTRIQLKKQLHGQHHQTKKLEYSTQSLDSLLHRLPQKVLIVEGVGQGYGPGLIVFLYYRLLKHNRIKALLIGYRIFKAIQRLLNLIWKVAS